MPWMHARAPLPLHPIKAFLNRVGFRFKPRCLPMMVDPDCYAARMYAIGDDGIKQPLDTPFGDYVPFAYVIGCRPEGTYTYGTRPDGKPGWVRSED